MLVLYSLWKGVNPPHCVKMLFDPVFSDPPLLLLSPIHLLIETSLGHRLHMLSLVCMARAVFFLFFFYRESACDQHRANQRCPDRRSGVMQPHRTVGELKLQALTSALLDTDRNEKRYLAVYIY
ncbi:unnamed protein product [Staurois parvus]|uniref:Uncharacterized protein n=1 Tax=Staurois parvus TaxID=386267 RepID=A0ABN9CEF2_9NEOB|nr:unnamed protein product [Staurois parvus]